MQDQLTAQSTLSSSDEDIAQFVREVIFELAPNQDEAMHTMSARLIDDLEYHSLALLELAFTLEDELSLEPIDEEVAQQIQTVGDVVAHVLGDLHSRAR
jgi:acyl carrier protein